MPKIPTNTSTSPPFVLAKSTAIKAIFAHWQMQNPHPTTELIYHNPYQLLTAVVMSAQTTDKAVNIATKKFFCHIHSPAQMLAWGEDNLRESIRTIGLYRAKAKNIITLSQQLLDHHDGEVPNTSKALMALAGVGLKTASVVMNTLYGAPLIAVDTHVFRVSKRIGLCNGKNVDEVAKALPKRVPKPYLRDAHHWLILHGRYVCKARKPPCTTCPIANHCSKNLETFD